MRKLTAAILCLCLLCLTAYAALYGEEAQALNQLGLFRGTEQGFELDKAFTRAEGAVMLVRLLGKEQEALSAVEESGFSDVPDWAEPYVGYCFENGITKGTGPDTFSPEAEMTGAEYLTLILRALGHQNANPDNAYIAAAENGLMSSAELKTIQRRNVFTRDYMVRVSYCALEARDTEGVTVLERLIADGVVTRQQAEDAGFRLDGKSLEDFM